MIVRLFVLLLVCSLSGACGSSKKNIDGAQREPANSLDSESLDTSFNALFNGAAPQEEMTAYLERVVRMFFSAQRYMQEFDALLAQALKESKNGELNPAKDPMLHPNYSRLQASREMGYRLRAKLAYFYLRLLQFAVYKAPPGQTGDTDLLEKKRTAAKVLSTYNKALRNMRAGAAQVAVQDLLEDTRALIYQWNETRRAGGEAVPPERYQVMSDLLLGTPTQQTRFIKNNRRSFDMMTGSRTADSDPALKQELEALATEMRTNEQRSPQSVFEPSPDKVGNIVGGNFPAGTWTLTYDDGPSARHTPTIVKNLVAYKSNATFFWLAQNVAAYPQVVKDVMAAGLPVENHSYTHANVPKLGPKGMDKEINQSSDEIIKALGNQQTLRFFRLPYGAGVNNATIRKMIADRDLIHVFWNVDSLDWQDKNPDSILKRVQDQMSLRKRGVILFHDIHAQSAAASGRLVELMMQDKNIRMLTIPQIVDELNGAH